MDKTDSQILPPSNKVIIKIVTEWLKRLSAAIKQQNGVQI